MIIRFLLIVLMAIALRPTETQAQQEAADLIAYAKGEIATLNDGILFAEQQLSDWEQQILLQERNGSGLEDIDRQIAATQKQVLSHPLLPRDAPECDDLWAEMAFNFPINLAVAQNCIQNMVPTALLPESLECSNLRWTSKPDGQIVLAGHVSKDSDVTFLQRKYGPLTTAEISAKPWPVCGALVALDVPMTSQDKPVMQMLNGSNRIRFNESLAFQVKTPDFFAFVYISYLQADGSVVNLTPRRRPLRTQSPPNTVLHFGDGREGRQTYLASAPAGPEAIIAIAARSPIAELEALEVGASGQYWMRSGTAGLVPVDQGAFIKLIEDGLADRADNGSKAREMSAELLHITVVP